MKNDMRGPQYIRLTGGDRFPKLSSLRPFMAVLVIEERASAEWQCAVSEWLVNQGCLYMMAWGTDCSSWDDTVDNANLARFDYESIPDDKFVITTWHDDESLAEVFYFAKFCAEHPSIDNLNTLILHIGSSDKQEEFITEFMGVA